MIRFNSSVHSRTANFSDRIPDRIPDPYCTKKKRAVKWPEAAAGQRLAAGSLWSGGVWWGLGCGVWFAETFSTTNSKKQQSSRAALEFSCRVEIEIEIEMEVYSMKCIIMQERKMSL